MMKILVVGGAGYIGSHMVSMLSNIGHDVVTLDNLCHGYRDAVLGGEFIEADLSDQSKLDQIFSDGVFDAVMHFASFIQVGESVVHPGMYYENNVSNTLLLLNTMVRHGVKKFIFSSTAAVYGEPEYTPIDEVHRTAPINPYGRGKRYIEEILTDFDRAYGLKSICLRYFNAAGAHPGGLLGERHVPETHLIPLVLQVASGRRKAISVYGRDYPTADGTCVRDYIHVVDLCDAHLKAVEKLCYEDKSAIYNLGNGNGFSVQEVIEVVQRVTSQDISVIDAPRRDGDPAVLVADSSLARNELGWTPMFSDLETIVRHAWAWEIKMHE